MTEGARTDAVSNGPAVLARSGPRFAVLTGLTSLAILLQGVFAGEFINRTNHGGWLSAHDINADVVVVLAVVTAVYAFVSLRGAARSLVPPSIVLAVLVAAQAGIGHAITDGNNDGLLVVHVPLALFVFGMTIWLSVSARYMLRSA